MSDIERAKSEALSKRKSLPALNRFDIGDLLSMPRFFDFVECCPDEVTRFKMFLGGNDDGVALRFFWNGGYETHSLKLWSYLSRRVNGLIMDIGAHTGAYTLTALKQKPERVLSFEPYFMNYARLSLNLRSNGFGSENAFMVAISDSSGYKDFSVNTDTYYMSTGGKLGSRKNSINYPVITVTIDNFLEQNSGPMVGLVKIDVEGHELNVLSGAVNLLRESRPLIFFESIDAAHSYELCHFLGRFDYSFALIDDLSQTLTPVADLLPRHNSSGILDKNRLNRLAFNFQHHEAIIRELFGPGSDSFLEPNRSDEKNAN